ncbi:MAG: hypothetical protein LBQ87_07225 [Candidatus Fibromonas sp.]|nr:hypothetical protein [Candidatus Fibromonas sp.]
MNKKTNSIFKALLILSALLLLLLLIFSLGKSAKEKLLHFLSNPINLGSVMIVPQNIEVDLPFEFKWGSIEVFIDGTNLFFEKPAISLSPPLGTRRELLNISIDSVYAKIVPNDSSKASALTESLSHPDLWLPFRVAVKVSRAAVEVKNIGKWDLDSLAAVKSARQKRFYISAKNIRGTHLAKNLFLNAEYRWNELFSDASLSVSDRNSDSLSLVLNAPRNHLEDLSVEINATVANLPFWLKDKWPDKAPGIEKITLYSNASLNILTYKNDFNLTLNARIGEFWQLPAFDAAITAFGSEFNIAQSEISLKGNNGESIRFKGNINKNLDGNGELELSGINITLGPETLPTDARFNRIIKRGNALSASFTTGAGSNFTARMADLNNPRIIFSADIVPEEPWAVQWTKGMVKLASPTLLTGSFSFKDIILEANLKTKVPFAYHATADELDVSLWLNPEGIHFPKGSIKRKGYESDFTGKVMWSKEYFTFKLNQSGGGEAEIHGTFDPKIDLNLKNINTVELPFADTNMLKGYNGFVSGNLNHDFKNRNGHASVSLSTAIHDIAINARSNIDLFGDSLIVRDFGLKQNEKKVNGSMFALLPGEARKEFEIQQAKINIPDMDLVSLLAVFNDSTLSGGKAVGSLEYNKGTGLTGGLVFSKIAIRGLDSNMARFPDLRLKTSGQSASISVPVFLNQGLWNGNLEASIHNIGQEGDFPVSVSYSVKSMGNIGNIKFDGYLIKDRISGKAQVLGDWFLPNGIGEIKNMNISISAKSVLGKHLLDSLTANFSTGRNTYEYGIFKIPFVFNGQVAKGMLTADPIFVYGENDEKITAKLQLDLNNAALKDLSFNTEQFTMLLLNEHWIKIRKGTGRTRLDPAGITIFADLPSISYRMESMEYGTAFANLSGRAEYRFPFQTELSQTNPSIAGSFEISNASYKKTLDLIPDPLHLDRTIKTINKFLESLVREKRISSTEMHAITSRPTTLNIRVQTSGIKTASVSSNIAEFEFVVNASVLGTTRNILLSGDIHAVNNGKIGYNGLTMFDMSSFRLYWRDSPIKQGMIELRTFNDYPFCSPDKDKSETCKVFMDITGPLSKLNVQPSTDCNIEASPALIYYSMLLGCISENYEDGSNFDRDKFTGKIFGKAMSSTINRIVGGNVIGDIDFKWRILNDEQEQDTNYVRVPISLSRWIENLELILGYTNSEISSSNPRYNESYEVGLRYKLPVFDSTDINRNLIDPALEINTNLVARRYETQIESSMDETRLEKNIGLGYRHKFWDPCILGIGRCKVAEAPDMPKQDSSGSKK